MLAVIPPRIASADSSTFVRRSKLALASGALVHDAHDEAEDVRREADQAHEDDSVPGLELEGGDVRCPYLSGVHLGESFPAVLRILPGRISQAIGVCAS